MNVIMTGKTGKLNKYRGLIRTGITAAVLLAAIIFSVSVNAWFYYGKYIAGITEIADPTVIFIKSGGTEEIYYLNLGGIDVENEGKPKGNQKYMDFVFCVRGSNLEKFRLQLAHTTNNQFEYEIYPALSKSEIIEIMGTIPEEAGNPDVIYEMHTNISYVDNQGNNINLAPHEKVEFYIGQKNKNSDEINFNVDHIDGSYLNKNENADEILALDSDVYHAQTYTPQVPENSPIYTERDKYAIPLYWQASDLEPGNITGIFTNFYILRVLWSTSSLNDKETDIIYISAKNTTDNSQNSQEEQNSSSGGEG